AANPADTTTATKESKRRRKGRLLLEGKVSREDYSPRRTRRTLRKHEFINRRSLVHWYSSVVSVFSVVNSCPDPTAVDPTNSARSRSSGTTPATRPEACSSAWATRSSSAPAALSRRFRTSSRARAKVG